MTALRYEPFAFEEADHPFFEPGRPWPCSTRGSGRPPGILRKALRDAYALDGPVYAAEIDLAGLLEKQPRPFQFTPVPRFPGVIRDLSFLVDRGTFLQRIQGVLARLSIPILEGFELTDRFSRGLQSRRTRSACPFGSGSGTPSGRSWPRRSTRPSRTSSAT